MDSQRQKEYADYYRVRMEKYEGNPHYRCSYETERALYELMRDAKSEEEYKEKFFGEKLNIKNAIALVKDRETLRYEHFMAIKEFIRARGPQALLEAADHWQNEAEITTESSNLLQKNSIEISVDGFTDQFYSDFMMLENIEVKKRAQVPDRWKAERQETLREMIAEGRKEWDQSIRPNARQWDPQWEFNYALIFEERHRRGIPMPDEVVKKRISDHKEYRGTI